MKYTYQRSAEASCTWQDQFYSLATISGNGGALYGLAALNTGELDLSAGAGGIKYSKNIESLATKTSWSWYSEIYIPASIPVTGTLALCKSAASPSNEVFRIQITTAAIIQLVGGGSTLSMDGAVTTGWHKFFIIINKNLTSYKVDFYCDGAFRSSSTFSGLSNVSSVKLPWQLWIGTDIDSSTNRFIGKFREMRFFDASLSQQDVSSMSAGVTDGYGVIAPYIAQYGGQWLDSTLPNSVTFVSQIQLLDSDCQQPNISAWGIYNAPTLSKESAAPLPGLALRVTRAGNVGAAIQPANYITGTRIVGGTCLARTDGTSQAALFSGDYATTSSSTWTKLGPLPEYTIAGGAPYIYLEKFGLPGTWAEFRDVDPGKIISVNAVSLRMNTITASNSCVQNTATVTPWVPTDSPAGMTSRPRLRFDGDEISFPGAASDYTFMHSTLGCTAVFVVYVRSFASTGVLLATGDAGSFGSGTNYGMALWLLNNGKLAIYVGGINNFIVGQTSVSAVTSLTPYVISYRLRSDVFSVRVNGAVFCSGSPVGSPALFGAPMYTARLGISTGGSKGQAFDCGGAVLLKSYLSDADTATIENAVRAYWGF